MIQINAVEDPENTLEGGGNNMVEENQHPLMKRWERLLYISIYIYTCVGSGGGGARGHAPTSPPTFLMGGNGMFMPPTFSFST